MLFMTELVVKLSLNISKDFKLLERQHNIDFSFVEEMKKILEDGSRFPIYIQKDAKLNREFHKVRKKSSEITLLKRISILADFQLFPETKQEFCLHVSKTQIFHLKSLQIDNNPNGLTFY